MTDERPDAQPGEPEPEQPTRSVWATSASPPEPAAPADAGDADDADDAEGELPTAEPSPPAGEASSNADEPADESDEPADEGDDNEPASDTDEPADETDQPASDTDEPEADEGADDEQRAALEEEVDRQLADLDVPPDGEEDTGPRSAADEADTLIDHLVPPAAGEPATGGPAAAGYLASEPTEEPDAHDRRLESIAEGAVLAERSGRGLVVPLVVVGLLIAVVVGIVVTAGNDDDQVEPGTARPSSTIASSEVTGAPSPDLQPMAAAEALGYFEVYGTQDASQLPRMLNLAGPGTPAHFYAVHQETLARIDPERNAPLNVSLDGEQIRACPQDLATGGCVIYSAFAKNEAGLLTHFSINGTPLRDRVAIGTGSEVTAGGMRVSVISRYVSVSDRIFVAYVVHNDGATPITPVSVRYVTPSGETVEPDNDTFRTPVQPGTFAVAAGAFGTTEAGGTLVIRSTADGGQSEQVASLQTP